MGDANFVKEFGSITCGPDSPQINCLGELGLEMLNNISDDEDDVKTACESFVTPASFAVSLQQNAEMADLAQGYLDCLEGQEQGHDDENDDEDDEKENRVYE